MSCCYAVCSFASRKVKALAGMQVLAAERVVTPCTCCTLISGGCLLMWCRKLFDCSRAARVGDSVGLRRLATLGTSKVLVAGPVRGYERA